MGLSFYTGATGFLGRNLLGALMRETRDEYLVLIRSAKSREIIERHVPADCLDRITYVTGGLRRPGLGLAPRDADLLKKCETFWHLAASTSFNDRDRDMLVDINVGGAQKILETARKARNLDRVFYMGTAYISGNNQGVIPQDEMPPNNGFKNCYEESKYRSELEVRRSGLPYVILRPSIVLGDSRTGDCQGENRMVYGYLLGVHRALCRYCGGNENFTAYLNDGGVPDNVRLRLVGYPHTVKNMICIDQCIQAITDIAQKGSEKTCCNLVSRNPLQGQDIRDSLEHSLKIKNVSYIGEKIDSPSKLERFAERLTSPFRPYGIHSDPEWEVDEDINLDISPETLKLLFEKFVTNHVMTMP